VTTEDDFHRNLDEHPDDWDTRLVFADWLQERDDPRASGYRAIVAQRRLPLHMKGHNGDAWWWHRNSSMFHNHIPDDWFRLLPPEPGNDLFWPLHTSAPTSHRSRRECEDALAWAFAKLPEDRQKQLLRPVDPGANQAPGKAQK
jgi:uncharacterized protein (TIGR02996 family)